MDPLKLSAQFAAWAWYLKRNQGKPQVEQEAVQFARENWVGFLPMAHEGVGRLLLKMAEPKLGKPRPQRAGSQSQTRWQLANPDRPSHRK